MYAIPAQRKQTKPVATEIKAAAVTGAPERKTDVDIATLVAAVDMAAAEVESLALSSFVPAIRALNDALESNPDVQFSGLSARADDLANYYYDSIS